MAKQNIPANSAAPANYAEIEGIINAYVNDNKCNKHIYNKARRLRRLAKSGASPDDIKDAINNESKRTVLCMLYGSYTVEDGTRTKKVRKRIKDKDGYKIKISTEDVPNILHGHLAAEKTLTNNNIKIVSSGSNYVYVTTDVNNLETIVEIMRPMGRICINKWVEKKEEPKKEKKPSNNTTENKKEAKKCRKDANKERTKMRAFYAAKRKGCISERIKKYNPKLAKEIEAWLKEQPERTKRKKKGSGKSKHGAFSTCKLQRKTLDIKRYKRMKKAQRVIIHHVENKAAKAPKNASKSTKKPTQQNLKFAA